MRDYPKNIKRQLREHAGEAYEQELRRELAQLEASFGEWRAGAITSGELTDRIHRYETGPARELFKQYNQGDPDMNVAYAIVRGILNHDEIAPEVLEAIERPLNFCRSLQERGELKE